MIEWFECRRCGAITSQGSSHPFCSGPELGLPPKRTKRRTIQVRRKIMRRDQVCQACGTNQDLTIDHIVPLALGGTNRFENLWVLCADCNWDKADQRLADWRPDLVPAALSLIVKAYGARIASGGLAG